MAEGEVGGARILIVDDEATLRTVLGAILSDAGFAVECCDSAEEALRMLARQACDALVVDKNLPAMNGIDLAREALARGSARRAVMITGYPSSSSVIEAVNVGIAGYLVKPFARVSAVVDEVRRVLRADARQTAIPPYRLCAYLRGGERLTPLPETVAVVADAAARACVERLFGPGARVFDNAELGLVAVTERMPAVVVADDLGVLQRLAARAQTAVGWYAGPALGFKSAVELLALGGICAIDPRSLAADNAPWRLLPGDGTKA
ncbi:MAG: response regulator [Deltaproteobacteria bacterium]|nr:response regulator [Deltaproteobacteria bacterium]